MTNQTKGFNGTVDLFEKTELMLLKETVDFRKRQKCSFSITGTRITTKQEWKEWRKLATSFWRPEFLVIPAAIITEKEINPGPILSLPDQFRFLLIPCFTELPLELPYLELFGFIRGTGGLTCLIPPLQDWNSLTCGLSNVDLQVVMVNGKENLSTALYHLNNRMRAGFVGINQIKEPGKSGDSFNRLFPVNYKLAEYNIFDCFRQGDYSVSNSCENFIACCSDPVGINKEDISGDRISFTFSCYKGKTKALLCKNGHSVSPENVSTHPTTRSFQVKGKDYYYLKTSDADFRSISSPFFVRSPHQLWGDHHVHYIFKNGLRDSRMDYIVYGLYGQVEKYEDFPAIVPGGEIHGTTNKGKPDNLHFLVVQNKPEDHLYSWEPGEGNKKTLQRAKKFKDFVILAHPGFGASIPGPQSIHPDGIEILHGFSLFAPIINNNPKLKQKALKVFGNELYEYAKKDSVKVATALWDEMLCGGRKCLGFADGDLHGPNFHGSIANNFGVGYSVTIINAENAAPSKVHSYLHAGNTWCVNTGFVNLHLKLNGKEMGGTTSLQKRNHLELIAESCFPITEIRFISQNKIIKKIHRESHEINETLILPGKGIGKYLRAELIDKNGNTAFANPVYIT